jgi:hypothetical protein
MDCYVELQEGLMLSIVSSIAIALLIEGLILKI